MYKHTAKPYKPLILSVCIAICLAFFPEIQMTTSQSCLEITLETSMKIYAQQNNKQETVSAFQHGR